MTHLLGSSRSTREGKLCDGVMMVRCLSARRRLGALQRDLASSTMPHFSIREMVALLGRRARVIRAEITERLQHDLWSIPAHVRIVGRERKSLPTMPRTKSHRSVTTLNNRLEVSHLRFRVPPAEEVTFTAARWSFPQVFLWPRAAWVCNMHHELLALSFVLV